MASKKKNGFKKILGLLSRSKKKTTKRRAVEKPSRKRAPKKSVAKKRAKPKPRTKSKKKPKKTSSKKTARKPAKSKTQKSAKKKSKSSPVKKKRAKSKSPARRSAKPKKPEKPVGKVTHFFGGIKVAIIKFSTPISSGEKLRFKGSTTDFSQKAKSFEYNHKPIQKAPKGKEVGLKVSKKVREGDEVYKR